MHRGRRKLRRKQCRRKLARPNHHRKRRRMERQNEKLRKMALKFGKTLAPNFGRAFHNSERQLTRHPYLNFLRYFKSKHPSFGFTRILQEGASKWKRMGPEEKQNFTQKEVLKTLRNSSKTFSNFNLFPASPVRFDYYPRSLSLRRNVERRLRNRQLIPQHDKRGKVPVHPRIWQTYV